MATVAGTYYKSTVLPAPVGSNRDITPVFSETFTPGSTGDIRQLLKLPINVCFGAGTFVQISDGDTDGTPAIVFSLRVTDGTTTKYLIYQSTAAQAGGLARPSLIPATENAIGFVTDNSDYRLELLIDTQADAAAAVTMVYGLHMCGWHVSGIKS
jgi:hypothetical protein